MYLQIILLMLDIVVNIFLASHILAHIWLSVSLIDSLSTRAKHENDKYLIPCCQTNKFPEMLKYQMIHMIKIIRSFQFVNFAVYHLFCFFFLFSENILLINWFSFRDVGKMNLSYSSMMILPNNNHWTMIMYYIYILTMFTRCLNLAGLLN